MAPKSGLACARGRAHISGAVAPAGAIGQAVATGSERRATHGGTENTEDDGRSGGEYKRQHRDRTGCAGVKHPP